jgi:hypothetical protein
MVGYEIRLCETVKEEKVMKYTFNSIHPLDIDFDLIAKDLCKSRPMAFVRVSDDEVYIVLHYSIVNKSQHIGVSLLSGLHESMIKYSGSYYVIELPTIKAFGVWKERVARVKNAGWKQGTRKAIVEVSVVNL